MMAARFNGNPSTTIICYRPTNASHEIPCNNRLSSLVLSIPKHNVLIIGEDMKAQISKNETTNCLHNSSNSNVKHLTDFSLYIV